jgi:hypothetical protein
VKPHPPRGPRSAASSGRRRLGNGATLPLPSADQLVPFQRAMRDALTPPAEVKLPPATSSPFGSGNQGPDTAVHIPARAPTRLQRPDPKRRCCWRGPSPRSRRSRRRPARVASGRCRRDPTWSSPARVPSVPAKPCPGSHCVEH